MVQTETLGEQAILRVNHVGVIVFGEFRFQTIGRLQAFAVSDAVGDDDIIFGGVQRLARAEQLTGKIRGKHTGGRAATAVKHQHRLTGKARLSWCSANAARAAHFAGMKFKIARGPIGFLWCGIVSGDRRKRKKRQCDRQRNPKKTHLGTCVLIGLIKRYTGCARLESRAADVCFWHKADMPSLSAMSAFGGKADIAAKLLMRDEARRIAANVGPCCAMRSRKLEAATRTEWSSRRYHRSLKKMPT